MTTILDNISDGIVLISIGAAEDYRLVMANKPFYACTGYPEQSAGKKITDIASPESSVFLVRQFKKVVKNKQQAGYLRWAEVPLGYRAFGVRLAPIVGTTGDVIQIACIVHDVTEREQLRTEVEHLREAVRGIRKSI